MLYQKITLSSLCLVIFLFILPHRSTAQGVYDLQFANVVVDCEAETLCFDIEVKANAPGTEFFFGISNIRFSFSRNLDNPVIAQELDLSGFIPTSTGPSGFSLYAAHNLTGSLDTVVSYNIELSGGDGELIGATDYVGIGNVCLDIVDFSEPVELFFHPQDLFPGTFIADPAFITLEEGTYTNYSQDISLICDPPSEEGTYDLQFANVVVDCEAETLCFDIEVKANAPDTEFLIGDINIRFGFSTNLGNPVIVQELELSGNVPGPGPQGFSFYSTHNLVGSADTLVSYNVELAAGDGVFIESTDYVGIGSMCLDIVDFDMPATLMFNMESAFPSTFIGSAPPDPMPLNEGTLTNYEEDINAICNPPLQGMYDLQFADVTIDCEEEILCFDIEVKASMPGTEFLFGLGNIRFGFSGNLDNPVIVEELGLSGLIPTSTGPQGFSLYAPHSLNGSLDTIVSYNIELSGGDGELIGATDYVDIGRMCLDILDFDTPATLMFNMEATFPGTSISETDFAQVAEGTYDNYSQDISFVCDDPPPPPEEVPTVGEWGLILLTLLMLIAAVAGMRSRREVYGGV